MSLHDPYLTRYRCYFCGAEYVEQKEPGGCACGSRFLEEVREAEEEEGNGYDNEV